MRQKRKREKRPRQERDNSWVGDVFEAIGEALGDLIAALIK